MTTHEITIQPIRRGRDVWFRAVCSCGAYRSKPRGYPGHAGEAGAAHVDAKKAA